MGFSSICCIVSFLFHLLFLFLFCCHLLVSLFCLRDYVKCLMTHGPDISMGNLIGMCAGRWFYSRRPQAPILLPIPTQSLCGLLLSIWSTSPGRNLSEGGCVGECRGLSLATSILRSKCAESGAVSPNALCFLFVCLLFNPHPRTCSH